MLSVRHSAADGVLRETTKQVPYSPVYSVFDTSVKWVFFFCGVQQPIPSRGRVFVEVSRSHTAGRTHLNEWSARRRGRYLHNTPQTREKSIRDIGIRTRNSSSRTATDLRVVSNSYFCQISIKSNLKTIDDSLFYFSIRLLCRAQWPRGLRLRSAAARSLRLWVRIPSGAWMYVVSVVCCQRSEIDHSSRGILPTVARRCLWSRNLENEEAKARYGTVEIQPKGCNAKKTNKQTSAVKN